jgi:sugar phosphate isomerase/epimerase
MQLSSAHIDPHEPADDLLRKRELMAAHGLIAHSFGVAESWTTDQENRHLFEFAGRLGLEVLVVEPQDPHALDSLERLAVEYAVDVAVHNHGPGTAYADPATLRGLLEGRHRRVGVCLDSGWITAARYDPSEVFRRYAGRVLDIHLKDLAVSVRGEVRHVAPGEGDVDLAGLIGAAIEARFTGLLAIESDAELYDAAGFLRSAAALVKRLMAAAAEG